MYVYIYINMYTYVYVYMYVCIYILDFVFVSANNQMKKFAEQIEAERSTHNCLRVHYERLSWKLPFIDRVYHVITHFSLQL